MREVPVLCYSLPRGRASNCSPAYVAADISFSHRQNSIVKVSFYHYKVGGHVRRYMLCELGDWSGDWTTPRGSAIEERRLKPSRPVITPS